MTQVWGKLGTLSMAQIEALKIKPPILGSSNDGDVRMKPLIFQWKSF